MIIMKFGGVSVDSASRMLHVADLVSMYQYKSPVVIVSAMKGITNKLLSIINLLKNSQLSSALMEIDILQNKHVMVSEQLHIDPKNELFATKQILQLCNTLKEYSCRYSGKITPKESDFIVSFGERLSAALVAQALSAKNLHGVAVDSGQVIVCTSDYGQGRALLTETRKNAQKVLFSMIKKNLVPVVTGFYGQTKTGNVATLGRGGSDYSASILANVCDAEEMIVWKEVDGVYTSDPKVNKDAKFLSELSYEEAATLARNGAKVLHPETMEPARIKNIVIWVKNTFKPEFSGTKIY